MLAGEVAAESNLIKKLLAVIGIAMVLLLPLALKAEAQDEVDERSLVLKVTNTKTGTVHTRVWEMSPYSFEKSATIDVPDFRLNKIITVFGFETFSFTYQTRVFEAKWLHFDVELIGSPFVGKTLKVEFV